MKSTVYKLKIKSAYETPRNIGKSLWFKFEMVLLTFQSLDKICTGHKCNLAGVVLDRANHHTNVVSCYLRH